MFQNGLMLKLKFPKINRNITELFKKSLFFKVLLSFFLYLVLFVLLAFSLSSFERSYQEDQKAEKQIISLESQIRSWEQISQKYPGHKDFYLQLAVLEYQVENFSEAREYLDQAIKIDPNFKEALKLDKELLMRDY